MERLRASRPEEREEHGEVNRASEEDEEEEEGKVQCPGERRDLLKPSPAAPARPGVSLRTEDKDWSSCQAPAVLHGSAKPLHFRVLLKP